MPASRTTRRVRAGLLGHWDRFVGPGASRAENAGTFALVAAGALAGDAWHREAPGGRRALVKALAVDLWGGAWVNNTRASVEWYERTGQGVREHLGFAAVHALHPALVARFDADRGARGAGSAARWALSHYALMLASTAVITTSARRARLPLATAATAAGVAADRHLGPSTTAPWFAPIYYAKLLIGHAAGSVWRLTAGPLRTGR